MVIVDDKALSPSDIPISDGQEVEAPPQSGIDLFAGSPLSVIGATITPELSVTDSRKAREKTEENQQVVEKEARRRGIIQEEPAEEPTEEEPAKPSKPAEPAEPEEPEPLVLADPETGEAKARFFNPELNITQIQNLLGQGFQVLEGTVPEGVSISEAIGVEVGETNQELLNMQQELQDTEEEINEAVGQLDELRTRADEASEALIASVKSQFEARKKEMRDINKRRVQQLQQTNIRLGTTRFAGPIAGGTVAEEERAGIQRIAKLDAEMSQLVAEARQAQVENDFTLLNEKVSSLEEKRKQQQETLADMNEKAIERQEELREENRKVGVESTIVGLVQSGMTSKAKILDTLLDNGFQTTADEVSDVLDNIIDEEDKLTGEARDFQSMVAAGLIDDSLNKQEQWQKYLQLTGEDKLLTSDQLKHFPSLSFGARESDAFGLTPVFEEGEDDEQPEFQLSSTEARQTRERVDASNTLLDLAVEYRNLIKEKGFTSDTIFGDKEVLGKINGLRAQMTAAYKDAKKLGTLDEGLLMLMEDVIGIEPTSGYLTPLRNITGAKADQVIANIDTLIDTTSNELQRDTNRLRASGIPITVGDPNVEAQRKQLPEGRILVEDRITGERGSIGEDDFDPAKYKRI